MNVQNIDRSNMLARLTGFPDQFRAARQIGEAFQFSIDPATVKNIVFAGMGGSAIGGDLIMAILGAELTVPALAVRNYFLPHFVDKTSLVIVSSYSGNTEESLSCYEDARAKGARLLCITSGGSLAQNADRDGVPFITVPGGAPPRTALGYLSMPTLVQLKKNGFANPTMDDFDETARLLDEKAALFAPGNAGNPAISLAEKLQHKIPILYSSVDFLHVVGTRWKGQFSENSKTLAFSNVFPELNHNEIVGWERLPVLLEKFQLIYLRDEQDFIRNQKRMMITREILEHVTAPVIEVHTEGTSKLARLLSLIHLGDWVSYYLAINSGVDPTPVEKIQILKDRLKAEND